MYTVSPPKRRRRWRHTVVRFLPTQEWSTGERGIVGECCLVAGGLSPWRFLLSQEWSVGERECVGVFWHCVVFRLRRILRGVAAHV